MWNPIAELFHSFDLISLAGQPLLRLSTDYSNDLETYSILLYFKCQVTSKKLLERKLIFAVVNCFLTE
jgi:hypothetical protein